MGASESTSRPITSLESLHIETGFLREKMDRLLEYSIHELTIQDFMKLSDPNHCKQYVMMMANQIKSHFYELQIEPAEDRRGVLFFREAKELTTGVKGAEKVEKDRLCLQLAYFYVRIFQIYGALAMSVVDDMRAMHYAQQARPLTDTASQASRGLLARGARPYLRGGAPLELGAFRFLKSFLSEDDTYGGRIPVHYPGITFSFDKTPYTATGARRQQMSTDYDYFHGEFHIRIQGAGRQESILMIRARKNIYGMSQDIECTFTGLSYYPADTTSPRVTLKGDTFVDHFPGISMKFTAVKEGEGQVTQYHIDGRSVDEYMRNWFDTFIPLLRELLGSPIPSSVSDAARRSETTPSGVPSALDINPLIRTLQDKTKRPHGHCAARALQLLGTLPYGQAGESFICKTKFIDLGGKPSSNGLPERGASLHSSLGLASTEVLFYDLIADGRLAISQGKSMQEYTAFMTSMAKLFVDDQATVSKGLRGIVNRRDGLICKADGPISITDDRVKAQVTSIAIQLFQRQWAHAKECDRILQMLFLIQKDPSGAYRIQLHPDLLKEGIKRVNEINERARVVLAQYYANCEATYLDGMKVVATAATTTAAAPSKGGRRNKTRKRASAM